MPYGEKNKVDKEKRKQILALKGKKSAYKVAEDFDVSHTTIYKIWNPEKYKSKKVSNIDTAILKRMIPVFVDKGLKVSNLSPAMVKRIRELYQEVTA